MATNGLSIQGLQAASNTPGTQFLTRADLTPPGPTPSSVVDVPTGVGRLQYPNESLRYWLQLDIHKYSRTSWVQVGTLEILRTIVLPLPQMMIDNHSVSYEVQPIGLIGSGILGAKGLIDSAGNLSQDAIVSALKTAGQGALEGTSGFFLQQILQNSEKAGALFAGSIGAQAARQGVNGVLAAVGVAINEFMTVMLRGPNYKRRDFQWKVSPKSLDETKALKDIEATLNDSMAPRLVGPASAFFGWPLVFRPSFKISQKPFPGIDLALTTFAMKPCVLTDASFNYTGAGQPAFFRGGGPIDTEIRLSFLELELWLAGQFGSGIVPNDNNSQLSQTLFQSNPPSAATAGPDPLAASNLGLVFGGGS